MNSALYIGRVMHARLKPARHRFRHRVFSLLLDVDELPALAHRLRLFSHNRFNLFSFRDRDHGEKDGESPRRWAERQLAENGLQGSAARLQVLCFPRMYGYVFNPLSVWFCHRADGQLGALIYEVHNTFGERHTYVRRVMPGDGARGVVAQSADKEFYVSPFIDMGARYAFRVRPPGERVAVVIREYDGEGELLRATLSGERRPLTDGALLRALVSHPLMTLKVTAAIYWHALRLWRKRVPAFRHVSKDARQSGTEARQ